MGGSFMMVTRDTGEWTKSVSLQREDDGKMLLAIREKNDIKSRVYVDDKTVRMIQQLITQYIKEHQGGCK